MKRIMFGNRVFVPTGKPKPFGLARKYRRLSGIDEYGLARRITIVVGQNKGKEPHNRKGSCARKASKFSTAAVDREFFRIREDQVGRKVAGTRVAGRGWYEGAPESSVAYEVSYIPPEGGGPIQEPSFEAFRQNMDRLAERLAETFCQDSVLILRDDGKKRTVAAATWKPKRRR